MEAVMEKHGHLLLQHLPPLVTTHPLTMPPRNKELKLKGFLISFGVKI